MAVSDEASAIVVEMLGTQHQAVLDNEIANRRREIDRHMSRIEDWRCEITRTLSTVRSQQRMLDIVLEVHDDAGYADHLIEQWEQLRSHPRLASVHVGASTTDLDQRSLFLLSTDDLRLYRSDTEESRWLGAFEIEVTIATGTIKMRNLNTRRGGRDHPHVVDQKPCFGGHHDAFAQLMSSGDLFVLYELLIQYIETLNLEDEYGRYGAYWFEVEDEQPVADGEGDLAADVEAVAL